ncbi:hypothetical protein LOTGIDRAFT_168081 [Lottia gigantea]|uniref:Uncharacterized protein n=1 Tax=Lottia gigantea TaxID=225164 RepID=V3ZR75_LOTGI|nr:hypothetical protein LOTGIDRAFT_168081 [Lottia gigantea]ESO85060.1 hypothetical protein LOTGIDRAFT_168081 [Lottia gigantea]
MGDMGWLKGDNLVKIELFRYWNRLKLNDNILCKTVHKWASRRKSSWDHRVLSIGRELHVLNDQSDTVCIDDVWDSLWEREVGQWSRGVWNDMLMETNSGHTASTKLNSEQNPISVEDMILLQIALQRYP